MKRKPEQWKTIKDYPNYMISSWGRVWSKNTWSAKGPHILPTQTIHGYYKVRLWKHNHVYSRRIHRLVAQAFISNPHHYPIVNHKDENRKDNYYKNLEWCTVKYNNDYSYHHHIIRYKRHFAEMTRIRMKPIILFHNIFDAYYFSSHVEACYFVIGSKKGSSHLNDDIDHNWKFHGWNVLPLK